MSQVRIPPSAPPFRFIISKINHMPSHPQSANRLTERVCAVVRSAVERAEVPTLLVACSGGADSSCLLHAVTTIARHGGQRVIVCHVRHGVRADDGGDADTVRTLAKRLDVECHIVSLPEAAADLRPSSSEGALRIARYRALAAVADATRAGAVLTGHTLDDQAETVLLHLIRGAGVDGLGGMGADTLLPLASDSPAETKTERSGRRLRVIRPLLAVRHTETVAYCAVHRLVVATDPTNDDQRYTRNWLRHAILPALRARNPDITTALARSASTMRDDATFLAAETASAIARCDCRFGPSCASLNQGAFALTPVALQRRILRDLLTRITGAVPRAADVEAMRWHAAGHSSVIRQYGGIACALAFGRLILGADDAVAAWVQGAASRRYPLSLGETTIYDDTTLQFALPVSPTTAYVFRLVPADRPTAEHCGPHAVATPLRLPDDEKIIIRNRNAADRFQPSGSARPILLRAYLRARGVPAPVRDQLPLLVVNDTIVWVIGHEVGAAFTATAATATHIGILTRLHGQDDERIAGNHGRRETADTGNSGYADGGAPYRGDDSGEGRCTRPGD
jgi:tRNA(Ile)-lysidine synthase